ncbi:fumarylacetoacetate hydrolase family protein [Nocardiopsis suaedae]|uniref:fumarylacetoacetase n=1 Tax=Nocardiopsis suaedae TaxID=3018444 RepID=A0ABT4TRC7_9ACTN|nr:fumarylacetoacetate hydrolase family protein [Nocardiopsis suaedae]MDA2807240.1 fumarylacetoacetate hydrolase family protein [Nocardiopsis suaedae]
MTADTERTTGTRTTWVSGADEAGYGADNLPYGVFREGGGGPARVGARIGGMVLDLAPLLREPEFARPSLVPFMARGPIAWRAVRARIAGMLADEAGRAQAEPHLIPLERVEMAAPVAPHAHTGYLCSLEYASNAARILAPGEEVLPGPWEDRPLGGGGRPASVTDPGGPVPRPRGRRAARREGNGAVPGAALNGGWEGAPRTAAGARPPSEPGAGAAGAGGSTGNTGLIGSTGSTGSAEPSGNTEPSGSAPSLAEGDLGPSRRLDVGAELAFVVGAPSTPGSRVPVGEFAEHVFGAVLIAAWSARDLPAEDDARGPLPGRAVATSVSPWVVPLDALGAARIPARDRRPPLPHLRSIADWALAMGFELRVNGQTVARPRLCGAYWTPDQLVAQLTADGTALETGDLVSTGTVSGAGPAREERGSLLELGDGGEHPLVLADGSERAFLEDGDRVSVTATAPGLGGGFISLGEAEGTVAPASQE